MVQVATKFFRFKLTGKGSVSVPDTVMRELFRVPGASLVLIVGEGYQECYFQVDKDRFDEVVRVFEECGDVAECTGDDITKRMPPVP